MNSTLIPNKPLVEAATDLLKQLLPNLAASSTYDLLINLLKAGGSLELVISTFPAAIPLLAVSLLGYIGLQLPASRRTALNQQALEELTKAIKKDAALDHDYITTKLAYLGYRVAKDFSEVLKRLSELQDVLTSIESNSSKAFDILSRNEALYGNLERFLTNHLNEVQQFNIKLESIKNVLDILGF